MAQVLWVSLRERRAIGYFFLFCFVFFFFFFFDIYNMEATCCWLLLALVPTVSKHLVIKSGKRGEGVGNRSVEIQVIGSLSPAGRLQITIVEKKREKKRFSKESTWWWRWWLKNRLSGMRLMGRNLVKHWQRGKESSSCPGRLFE